ncbi:MAG TPA: cell division protein ZapA, partial [Ruegeria sp.]|nr:cell division protein ZapA [Ruegeria sp.]
MPEVTIHIGGRAFEVSCQEGEESFLQSAAKMLDDEAQVLSDQIGRMPEARMLLMAGLMLADKTAAVEDKIGVVEARLAEREAELEALKAAPAPEPERVEVAVIPPSVTDTLAELA